jgi:hypothetical protein
MGGGRDEAEITKLGTLVLRALRTYLATRWAPFDVPGHETRDDFRSRDAALEMVQRVPGLYELVLDNAKHFDWSIQYDAPSIAEGLPSNGKGQLILRAIESERASFITLPNPPILVEMGRPVDTIWFERPSPGAQAGTVDVTVYGPHDVLRVLAYEVNAVWS